MATADSYRVETIPPYTELGEGPHWDVARQSLYYVSLSNGLIHRFDYAENKVYGASIDGASQASFIIPVKGQQDCFVIGDTSRVLVIRWDGLSERATIVRELASLGSADSARTRFNDGKVDPWGRLYAGSLLRETVGSPFEVAVGSLYRYCDKSEKLVTQDSGMFISNGLAWNRHTHKFYFADSGANFIKEYDIDLEGNLTNGTIWYEFKAKGGTAGFADGMTIDTEGNLFVAMFNGFKVLKISPQKKILQEIKIPAQQVTSVAFGGPKLDELFVTTAAKLFTTPQKDPAGATFKVTGLGAKGYPMDEIVLKP